MNFSALKNFLDYMAENRTPGNAIEIYQDGRQLFRYAAGYSDWENKIPFTGDELLNLYSCSKITTVTAGLQLLEQGKFLLTDPLYAYIPQYRDVMVKDGAGHVEKAVTPITIGDLFSMTAGFSYDMDTPGIREARKKTDGHMDTATVVTCMASDPLDFQPGSRWQYSLCHDVLAGLISIITGQPFRDYVKEHIFDPLDIQNTFYHHTPETLARTAQQYHFSGESELGGFDLVKAQASGNAETGYFENVGRNVLDFILGDEYDSGGAGITSTLSDYNKLLCALAQNGIGRNGERILSPCSVRLMRTNRLTPQQLKSFDWEHLQGCGYGLGVRTHMDPGTSGILSSVGEFGWAGAAGSTIILDSDLHLSVFYVQHILNPREAFYQPRLRNLVYAAL